MGGQPAGHWTKTSNCGPELVDRQWDDEGIIPRDLTPDTAYVFGRMTQETLDALDIRPCERVLDVGCGQGIDLISQKFRGAKLFGLDGSLVMIQKASENFSGNGLPIYLASGSAEHLPFTNRSFHKVYCKGALDHFYDPSEALREMLRVLKPWGYLVISVANFESLSCRLGRLCNLLHRCLQGRELSKPHFWQIPEDHLFKFDHPFLIRLLPNDINPNLDRGISLLWGLPYWGKFLMFLPSRITDVVLKGLDLVARVLPSLADVMVVRIRPSSRSDSPVSSHGHCHVR